MRRSTTTPATALNGLATIATRPLRTRRRALVVASATVLLCSLFASPAAAGDVEHLTVFATRGTSLLTRQLNRLTLDASGRAIARTPVQHGDRGRAHDVGDSRMVFVRWPAPTRSEDGEIWLREPSGQSRMLTRGSNPVFTPGRSAVFFTRREHPATDVFARDVFYLYYLADSRVRRVGALGEGLSASRLRFSRGGTAVWMILSNVNGMGFDSMGAFSIAEQRFVAGFGLHEDYGWWDYELLPSGERAIFVVGIENRSELWTVRLSDGSVANRMRLSAGDHVASVRGRLSDSTLLVSGATGTGASRVPWLAALELRTMTLRRLPGTTGYYDAVTAY